jgi:chitinase
MTYDLHGYWDKVTGENTPLYAGPADTTDYQRKLNVVSISV